MKAARRVARAPRCLLGRVATPPGRLARPGGRDINTRGVEISKTKNPEDYNQNANHKRQQAAQVIEHGAFGRMYSARIGKAYLGYRPSKKSIKRMVENVHALTCVAVAHDELFRFLLDGRPLRIREGLPLLCAGYR
jgi:hypothetical protein